MKAVTLDNPDHWSPNASQRILVVENDPQVRELICRQLTAEGYESVLAPNNCQALFLLDKIPFALVIADIDLSGSGLDLLGITKQRHPETAILMITAEQDKDTAISVIQNGAYGYMTKPFTRLELIVHVTDALARRDLLLNQRDYEFHLEKMVEVRTRAIKDREEEIALRLLAAGRLRDEETGDHIRRIGFYSLVLAETYGLPPQTCHDIKVASTMHDIGKIGIPDHILRKPAKLTADEFEEIKKHPAIGAELLRNSSVPLINLAHDIALHHHEKWDGSGYPGGLSREQIPLAARIVAIADVFDALSSDRVYRKALPEIEVEAIMHAGNGSHFDPTLATLFLRDLGRYRDILQENSLRACQKIT